MRFELAVKTSQDKYATYLAAKLQVRSLENVNNLKCGCLDITQFVVHRNIIHQEKYNNIDLWPFPRDAYLNANLFGLPAFRNVKFAFNK